MPEYATHPSWVGIHVSPNCLHRRSCIWHTWLAIIPFFIILFRRQIWSCFLELIITVLLEVWHHCNPPHPPLINYLPPSVSICCHPYSFLLPATYHLPFIFYPPPFHNPWSHFLDFNPSLGIGGPPGIVPRWYQWRGGSHTSFYCPPFPPHKECLRWGCIPHIYWDQRRRPKGSWSWPPPNPPPPLVYNGLTVRSRRIIL